jgi:hypothetical protein
VTDEAVYEVLLWQIEPKEDLQWRRRGQAAARRRLWRDTTVPRYVTITYEAGPSS